MFYPNYFSRNRIIKLVNVTVDSNILNNWFSIYVFGTLAFAMVYWSQENLGTVLRNEK